MVIRFIFFRSFQKYIMGMDIRKTKGFREFYIRKFIYFKQMDISGYTIVGLCILMKTPLF